jgi:hypothetical protein
MSTRIEGVGKHRRLIWSITKEQAQALEKVITTDILVKDVIVRDCEAVICFALEEDE